MLKKALALLTAGLLLLPVLPTEALAWNHSRAYRPESQTELSDTAQPSSAERSDTEAGKTDEPLVTEAGIYINPLYIDVISQEDIPVPDPSSSDDGTSTFATEEPVYTESYEEVGATLREGMAARYETITAYYHGEAYTQDYFNDLVKNHIIPAAMEETENPNEGDYLRYNYGGMGYRASLKSDSAGEYTYYTLTFTPTYYTTADQEDEVTQKVETLLAGFDFQQDTPDYEKIYTVYDYICSTVTYDHEHDSSYKLKYTTYAALINGTSVCQGYATLVYRLLRELDLGVRVATGYGGTASDDVSNYSGNHAWNIVQLDEKWYYADATWDANFSDDVAAGTCRYQYLLKGTSDFDTLDAPYSTDGIHYLMMDEAFTGTYAIEETKYCPHSWDDGVVTQAPTVSQEGIKTHTCTLCGATKTEVIPAATPSVTLSLSQNGTKVRMTGRMTNAENTTGHGFVYITKARLGSKTLTVNTTGRTKVSINGNDADGSYRYSMTPRSESTTYVFRAYVTYMNDAGKTVYVYSNPIYTSYSQVARELAADAA